MEFEKTEIRKLENCRDILVNLLLLFELDKNNKKARIDQLRDELRIINRRIEELRRNVSMKCQIRKEQVCEDQLRQLRTR